MPCLSHCFGGRSNLDWFASNVLFADTEDEFDETLEVVVTAAEGFEVPKTPNNVEGLPAPMRLTILGKGPAPRLERVKRLLDGRVLLGGSASVDGSVGVIQFSTDLKTWHPLTNATGGNFSDDSGSLWLDASATNAVTRYYRAVAP